MKHIQLSAVSFVISPAEQTWSISTIHYAAVLLYWRQTHFHYWIHHLLHKVFRDTNTCFHQCQRCKHCSTLSFVSVHENRNENESRLLKWFKHKPERRRRTEKLKQTNVESQREGEGEGERREERGERREEASSRLLFNFLWRELIDRLWDWRTDPEPTSNPRLGPRWAPGPAEPPSPTPPQALFL